MKTLSNCEKITEKTKRYLRNVNTNDIIEMNKRVGQPMFRAFGTCSKGAGNYALYYVRKKY